MAQPPLSQQIRQLERELGVTLLTRSTRTVELTPAGRTFLDRAREILDAVDGASDQARRIAEGVEGRLMIGCVGSATYSLLPRLVRVAQVDARRRAERARRDVGAGPVGRAAHR